jgi:hypothetical protein
MAQLLLYTPITIATFVAMIDSLNALLDLAIGIRFTTSAKLVVIDAFGHISHPQNSL